MSALCQTARWHFGPRRRRRLMSLDHFYPKCVTRRRAKVRALWLDALKRAGPRFVFTRWRWCRSYFATDEGGVGVACFRVQNLTGPPLNAQESSTIFHNNNFPSLSSEMSPNAPRPAFHSGGAAGTTTASPFEFTRPSQQLVSPVIIFSVLRYKMCIQVASGFFSLWFFFCF